MRTTLFAFLAMLSSSALAAQPLYRLDAVQSETAKRLVQEGDTVRLFDPRSTELVYEPLIVESRRAVAVGQLRHFLINGERVDIATVWLAEVDDPRRFANLATMLGFTVEGAPAEWPRALDPATDLAAHAGFYTGTLAEHPVQMSLVLDGRRMEGFFGEERSTGADVVFLTGKSFNATRTRGETLELVVRDSRDRILAVVRGALDAQSRTFSGQWTPLDGAAPLPFALSRVADYAIRSARRGAADWTAVYPVFRHPPASGLNDVLGARIRAEEEAFLESWSGEEASPGVLYRQRLEIVVSHHRPELVSLRRALGEPGDGTGAMRFAGLNFRQQGSDFVAFSLAECIRPAAGEKLAALIVERLQRQGRAPAGLDKLDPSALERFYLVPGGIRFLLPSEGSARLRGEAGGVSVGFRELDEILAPQGPLGRFVAPR